MVRKDEGLNTRYSVFKIVNGESRMMIYLLNSTTGAIIRLERMEQAQNLTSYVETLRVMKMNWVSIRIGQHIKKTLVKPIFGLNEEFIGIIGISPNLGILTTELLSKNEILYIVDVDGYLIVSNLDKSTMRIKAHEYLHNNLIKGSAQKLINIYGNYSNISEKAISMKINSKKYFTRSGRINDGYGYNLIIISLCSVFDIYTEFQLGFVFLICIGICMIIIVFSISLIFCFSYLVTKPFFVLMNELKSAVKEFYDQKESKFSSARYSWGFGLNEIRKIRSSFLNVKRLIENFTKFIPSLVVKKLINDANTVKCELSKKKVSVLFVKIKDFAKMNEKLRDLEVVYMLSRFFSLCESIARRYKGVIDKYNGDEVMIVFNTPKSVKYHERNAVLASIDIVKESKEKFSKDKRMNKMLIDVICSVNTGVCLTGFIGIFQFFSFSKSKRIGCSHRMSFSTFGECIGTGFGIVLLNEKYHTNILIGEMTYNKIYINRITFPGKLKWIGKYKSKDIWEVQPNEKTINRSFTKPKVMLGENINNSDDGNIII